MPTTHCSAGAFVEVSDDDTEGVPVEACDDDGVTDEGTVSS